jgi:hypothetical protein
VLRYDRYLAVDVPFRHSDRMEGTMSEEQEKEIQRYIQIMRQVEAAHDEIGMRKTKQEIDRLMREMRDNPDKP